MLREIMMAIASALGRVCSITGRLIKGFVMLPFSLFGGGGWPSIPKIDTATLRQRMAAPAPTPGEMQKSLLRDSAICWSFVSGSLGDRQMRPMPSALSRKMQSWLMGLDHRQLVALKNAGPQGVFEHSIGRRLVPGVLPVGPLKPVDVCFPPSTATVHESLEPRLIRRFA
jgi:hypothetical protein